MANIKYSILVLFSLSLSFLNAQTEAEMKTQADKLFDNEQYLDATPLYLRLLSLQPKDVNYNYKYGTCLLYNSDRKADAIKYLSFAVNTEPDIVPEAYYFLGKALHLNYQFNEAIKNYTKYNENIAKAKKKFDAEREIQMCQNGKRLITTISDIIVLDKKEISREKFFRIYDLENIGGSMLVTAEFQTKLDKKNNHIPLIHFPSKPSVIYYSSYGDNENTGKDIYVRRRLPDGSWGMPQALPGNVNTKFDEDFPYMHPDGNYLYFSSKGHNSMGGFDVFRSKYDPETNSFGPPENIDFAISSPDDDMFYIVDSLNQNAYFASARQSKEGLLYVYKVKVDRVPLQLSVVKGNFISEIDPKIKRIDFEIRDYSNGELIGKFNSNEKAVYLITFPKGGKYEYIMTIEGSKREFRAIVSIPFLKEFKPLKQKIVHVEENGKEVVKIIDLFNEEVDDPQAILAEVIRKRSDLNVNVKEFNLEELEKDKKNKEILKEIGMGNLLLVEVSQNLKDKVESIQRAKQETDQLIGGVNAQVVRNTQDFARLEEQIKEKVAEANKTQNPESKYILMREADQLIRKQEELKEQSKRMLNLTDSIQQVVKTSESAGKLQQLDNLAKTYDQLYREGKENEALEYLANNKGLIVNALNDRSLELKQNLVERSVKIDDQLRSLNKKIDEYNRNLKDLEIQIQVLENSKNTAKKKELEEIDRKIQDKKTEMDVIRSEKKKLEERVASLDQEKFQVNQQIYMIEEAIGSKSNLVATRDAANKALKETEKTNTNTLNSYVQQQIAELERNDPTLRDRIIVSSGMKAENILAEHRTQQQRIQTNTKLTRQEQTEKLLNNARRTKAELEARLRDVEKQLDANRTDAALQRERDQIRESVKDLDNEIDRHERELAAILSPVAKVDRTSVEKAVDPNYENKQQEIANNSSLSKSEKLQKQQELDELYLAQLDEKIRSNEARLKNDPTNIELQKEGDLLKTIKADKQEVVADREKEIRSMPGNQAAIPTDQNGVIRSIDPDYEQKRNSIIQNSSLSKADQLNREQQLDRQFVDRLNERLLQNEASLKADPTNKQLIDQNKTIQELKAEKEKDISARQQELNTLSAVTKVYQNDNELINALVPTYNSTVSAIQNDKSLSRKEQLERLQQEDRKLLDKISDRIEVLENKSDPASIQELNMLRKITNDRRNVMDARENQLLDLDKPGVVNSASLIASVDSDYEKDMKSIRDNMKINDAEKLKRVQLRDNELKDKLENELKNVDRELQKDPNNSGLIQRKEVVMETIAITESRIDERNQIIADRSASIFTPEQAEQRKNEILNKAVPGYTKTKEELLVKNDEKSVKDLISLQERLIERLENEKRYVEKALAKDPIDKKALFDLNAINEHLSAAKQLLEESKLKLKEPIDLAVSKKDKENLLSEIVPAYSTEKRNLEKLPVNDQQRAKDEVALEKQLLSELKERKSADENVLKDEPDNLALVKEVKVLEELIKESENRLVELEKRSTPGAGTNTEFTAKQLGEQLDRIAPEYASNVRQITEDPTRGAAEKMDALIIEDRLLLNELLDQLDAVDLKLEKDRNNLELSEEKLLLEQITDRLEKQIDRREIEQKSLAAMPLTAESLMRNQWIDQIDPMYKQSVRIIESNSAFSEAQKLEQLQQKDLALITKVQNRINVLDSRPKPMSVDELAELAELLILKDQILQIISERKELLARSGVVSTEKALSEEVLIERLLPDYRIEKEKINRSDRDQAQKQKDLIQLEEILQQKAENRLDVIDRQLAKVPKDQELKNERVMIEEIIQQSKEEAGKLERTPLTPSVSAEIVLTEVMPDYQSRRTEIMNSKMEEGTKTDALLKLENELLTKLLTEEKSISKRLAKDPSNEELKSKSKAVNELITVQRKQIAELENRKQLLDAALTAEKTLKTIDKSYEQDIQRLEALPESEEKYNSLADREQRRADLINEEIKKNEQILTKKSDPKTEKLNEQLKQEKETTEQRSQEYRERSTPTLSDPVVKNNFIADLREDLLGQDRNEIDAVYSTREELNVQDQVLARYEERLKFEISRTESELRKDPQNETLKNELQWQKEELAAVQQKRRQVQITIGELEREVLASERRVNSTELTRLEQEEALILEKLGDPNLAKNERKQLEKNLDANEQAQVKEGNRLLQNEARTELDLANARSQELKEQISPSSSDELKVAVLRAERENRNAAEMLEQANRTKSDSEKNILLNQALESTEKSKAITEQAIYRNELTILEDELGITTLETKGELESRKRRFMIEVGELTTEIMRIDRELGAVSKKEKPALDDRRAELVSERAAINREIQRIDEKLKSLDQFTPATLDPLAIQTNVSAQEEQRIAMSESYRSYVEKANLALATEREIRNLERQLEQDKSEVRELAKKQATVPSRANELELKAAARKVQEKEQVIESKRAELSGQQIEAEKVLSAQNKEEAMKMQNLISRGVEPISKAVVAVALLNLPSDGLTIAPEGTKVYTAENRIPINVNAPSGLVYRVQVGAFAKPIPQDLFGEFNPVSGETLNSGITRYMAGYFTNEQKVMEARNAIRALGYADAFPVAYCDGKRISIAEARQLAASGACLPKGNDQLMMEVALNTVEKVDPLNIPQNTGYSPLTIAELTAQNSAGVDDTTRRKRPPVIDVSYNQAPGAVKAEAIELRKGLFFTVQIGVFNKPVTTGALNNLEPYFTLRLPNGQIRYSTGIFHSIDEARPRKQEAIDKGVKDAFITAYYNGERITLGDAAKLLETNGSSILEPKELKGTDSETSKTSEPLNVERKPVYTGYTPIEEQKTLQYLQIVTKKQFTEFPTDVLNRYNSHGSFYFDESDRRVKSVVVNKDEDLPQVHYFRNDIDTLRFESTDAFVNGSILSFNFAEGALPGDLVDWLLRLNFRKEYLQHEEGILLFLHGIPEERIEILKTEAERFGITPVPLGADTKIREYQQNK